MDMYPAPTDHLDFGVGREISASGPDFAESLPAIVRVEMQSNESGMVVFMRWENMTVYSVMIR